MYYRVALQSALVSIMIDLAIECLSKDPQIPHAHALEEKNHRVQVIHQVGWPHAQCRCRNRRIDEIPSVGSADGSLRTEIRVPCWHVFYHENLSQRFEIRNYSIIVERRGVIVFQILAQRRN